MLRDFLKTLCEELSLPLVLKPNEKGLYPLSISSNLKLELRDLAPGIAGSSVLCPLPEKRREDLLIYLMRANLLGQGTGGCRIGVDPGEKLLTLSSALPYEMNYQRFREAIEDFANYVMYWREEVEKFEHEQQTVL